MGLYLGNTKVTLGYTPKDFETDWVRPSDWPNLDVLPTTSQVVYHTFDNSASISYHKACFYCSLSPTNGTYTIDAGYINNNNEFVSLVTATGNHNTYSIIDYSSINYTTYPYVVIRITPASESVNITGYRFGKMTVAQNGGYYQSTPFHNRCLDRTGNLPYAISMGISSSNYSYITYYMVHDNLVFGTEAVVTGTTLASLFSFGYALESVDLSKWKTTDWTVTSIASMFANCHNLRKIIGLENLKTSNWGITTMASMFSSCYSLTECKIGSWDVSDWPIKTLASAWSRCHELKTLDLNSWDVSDWPITNLSSAWANCYHLKTLKIGNWDVKKWPLTNLSSTWTYCYSLEEIEAFNWSWSATEGVTDWPVTTMASMCSYCYKLQKIDISSWHKTNFALTSIASLSSQCASLVELTLTGLNLSTITNASSYGGTSTSCIFNGDISLKVFNPPSNWFAATNFSTTYVLPRTEIVKFFNILTDNTGNTAINITFSSERYKLTAADVLILTNKNYTIS